MGPSPKACSPDSYTLTLEILLRVPQESVLFPPTLAPLGSAPTCSLSPMQLLLLWEFALFGC